MKARLAIVCVAAVALVGCTNSWMSRTFRSQSPEETKEDAISNPKLVSDYAAAYGLFPVRLEGVGLVSGLHGTGSDPAPSPQRGVLVADMKARGVESPNTLLATKNFAMVMVQGYLRPGIQPGDRFDVEVRVPGKSDTLSLRGGYLMQVRLREMRVLDDGQVHEGNVLAVAEGTILVDPSAKTDNKVASCRGRVLSGGRAVKERQLNLVLKPDHQNVSSAARVEQMVNKRFYTMNRGIQTGMAKARNDKILELRVHPRYKDNVERYMQVARSIVMRETPSEQAKRIERLKTQLLDPATAANAARQLEAIGRDGIEALRSGVLSADPEVRFFAAEALAYLDQREAVEPLTAVARDEPAFRVFALSALAAMDCREACEQLEVLLQVPSAETRYGAFRALWTADPGYPAILPDRTIKEFSYHVVDSMGPPMVHVTRTKRPEVVLFGRDQPLRAPFALNAGKHIMITAKPDGVAVARFAPGEPDQKRLVSYQLDEVLRAVVELGGTYPDVVQALEEARACNALAGRFEVDALPEGGRSFRRLAKGAKEGDKGGEEPSVVQTKTPVPSLFRQSDAPQKSHSESGEKTERIDSAKADDASKSTEAKAG